MRRDMRRIDTGTLAGWLTENDGPRVLLLHGGPGLSYDYLEWLADELGDGFSLAAFQQRGLAPSSVEGPFDLATAVADAIAVLDAVGWEKAWIVGHSWGGHLLVRLLLAAPERCLGGLAIDPLGVIGDGGYAMFEQAMNDRTPAADRARAEELDQRALRGEGTEEDALESMRLYWPAYFADRSVTPAMPELRLSVEAYSALLKEATSADTDPSAIRAPFGAVVGGGSPMPFAEAAAPTVARIEGAWLEVVPGAGHFPWYEVPGSVHAALTRLIG
jgi:proline iminopeptidase